MCHSAESIVALEPKEKHDTGVPEDLAPLEGRPLCSERDDVTRAAGLGRPVNQMMNYIPTWAISPPRKSVGGRGRLCQ